MKIRYFYCASVATKFVSLTDRYFQELVNSCSEHPKACKIPQKWKDENLRDFNISYLRI